MMPSKRDQLVETATRLFCEYGYQATGIDSVIAEAGVAKMTLYSHFKSKDELIAACLAKLDREAYEWFVERLTQTAPTARGQLGHIFDVLREFLDQKPFFGCPFMRAASEFPDLEHQSHMLAAAHKQKLHRHFQRLASSAGMKSPERVASEIQILMEGAMAMVQLTKSQDAIAVADGALKTLLSR